MNNNIRAADLDEYQGNLNAWKGELGEMNREETKNIHAYRKKLNTDYKSQKKGLYKNIERNLEKGLPTLNKQLEYFFPSYYPTHNTPVYKHPAEMMGHDIPMENRIKGNNEDLDGIDAVSHYEPKPNKHHHRKERVKEPFIYEDKYHTAPYQTFPNPMQYYPPPPLPQQPVIIEREKYSKRNIQAEKLSEAFDAQTKTIKGILGKIEEKHTKKHDIEKEYLKHKINAMENEVFLKSLQQEQENFMFAVKDSLDEFTNNMTSQNMKIQQQTMMPNMFGQMNPNAMMGGGGGWNGFPSRNNN